MTATVFDPEEQRRHIIEEFPRKYEMVDGGMFGKKSGGKEVPVPPQWVRERVSVPEAGVNATLARELAHLYPPNVRDVLVKYVSYWPVNLHRGYGLLITGLAPRATRIWAASAVMNEIVMRFGQMGHISTAWVNVGTFEHMLRMQERRDPDLSAMFTRLKQARLLLLIDPARLQKVDPIRLEILYEDRHLKSLPTITTCTTSVEDGDWSGIQEDLGDFVTEVLQETTAAYIAHY